MSGTGNRKRKGSGEVSFMRRLREDTRGNALMLTAAAVIPLVGIIGCGVDISRAYVVKTRLQEACDAGVIGGRKVMTSNGVDSTVTSEVQKFVNYNFPQQTMNTASFPVVPTGASDKSVNLSLATTMPTAVMRVLGVMSLPITASCTARQDYVNTDVVFVLDTTGSMNCLPSDDANANCPTEKSGSKISALRQAVASFYTALKPAQDELTSQGLRLRYGIIPYSSTVNVGQLLRSTNPGWVNTTSSYEQCTQSRGSCLTAPVLRQVTHPASFWSSWSGCIEERQTVSTIGPNSGYTPPAAAYDLDVNMVPTATSAGTYNNTAWSAHSPSDETATYNGGANGFAACPQAAMQLQVVPDVSTMNNYTNTLYAVGGTYHDIGMVWAARMLSPTGLWASNNPTSYNGFPVNRDVVFMTDGALAPNTSIYSAWGIEQYDKRVTGNANATTDYNSHLQRYRMMCNSVKGMNVNVWVIAFGTSAGTGLSADMINCASNSSQAFVAANQQDLINQFTQIGQTIGALRLSQ